MNYEIVNIEPHSGNMAAVYSVIIDNSEQTLYEQFLNENKSTHREELRSITNRLSIIGQKTGARANFFKHDEGKPGDGVCALYDDPKNKLRLYCIRFANVAIILGGGGPKTKKTQAWKDDEKLKKEAEIIIQISKDIMNRLKSGEIQWSEDGTKLIGNLKFSDNEE